MWTVQLNEEDQVMLVRSSCLDLLCLRAAITRYNPRLDCLQLYSGHHICKELVPAHADFPLASSTSSSTSSSAAECAASSSSTSSASGASAEDLAGFLRLLLDLAVQLHRLRFDPQELALFAALLVLSSGIGGAHSNISFYVLFCYVR